MGDPRTFLAQKFEPAMRDAFGDEHAATDPAIRRSDRADYQADAALALAKKLKRPPREVAEALAAKLDFGDAVARVEIAGPGFVNVTLSDAWLARETAAVLGAPGLGIEPAKAETVIIDYPSPNVAKEMHVGHLRTTIIGDALARVLEAVGHRVVRQNHLGDWGTPFGMLLEHMVDTGEDAESLSIGDLNAFYREARAKFDGDAAFADRARHRVVLLQAGDAPTLALWRRLVQQSKVHFSQVFGRLGITVRDEDDAGESFYNPVLADVVAELEAKGLAVPSEGALCVFPPGYKAPLIVRKQDGGYGYATTDLAAIRHRAQVLRGTRILYVVGSPQQQHLAMVFAAAEAAGWLAPPARAEHVAFGSVLGADKKMLKTRSGETIRLVELLDEAVERAGAVVLAKNPELGVDARAEVARQIGIGAIKFADLSNDRIKDYVFDWDRMLAFDGQSAPYLQYAHARIRSIFRRAGDPAVEPEALARAKLAPAERALALELLGFPGAVTSVAESLQPHRLCHYLFGVAAKFSTFFEECPVLKADDASVRAARLALAHLTAVTLARGLDLLGIEAPEQM